MKINAGKYPCFRITFHQPQPRDGPRVPFALASEVASHLDQELLTLLGNTYETLARDFHELPIYWTKFI